MSTTLATKTTTKATPAPRRIERKPERKPPYRTANGELVPQDNIIEIDGPGIEFIEGDDAVGPFAPTPVEQHLTRPSHPGAILRELYLPPTGLTQSRLAEALGVSRRTVNMILNEKMAVSADMAVRLSRAFGTSISLWLGLQHDCDVWDAAHANTAAYDQIRPLRRAA